MAAYLTAAELVARMKPDLGNRSISSQQDTAADSASAVIDAYLSAGGYTVPVASPPDLILKLCADIARYEVAKAIGMVGQIPKESIYYQDYEDAIKFLKDVQNGKSQIPGVLEEDETVGGPSKPLTRSNDSRAW